LETLISTQDAISCHNNVNNAAKTSVKPTHSSYIETHKKL